jgi:polyphosphate kinase
MVGRFLEHERIFLFGPAGEEELYLSSADWMPRNFDRRVEVMFPIANEVIRRQIVTECLTPIALDNCRVYEMDSDGSYHRRRPLPEEARIDAQMHTLDRVRRNRPRSVNYSRSVRPLAMK